MTDALFVDTHAHMCDQSFDADRGQVLKRAADAGIHAILSVSEDYEDAVKNLALSDRYPMLMPAAGIAPATAAFSEGERLHSLLKRERGRFRAVGEVGLDYWVAQGDERRAEQRELFEFFIECALELDLPLNVHSRSAGRQVIELLTKRGATRVQLHAFDGKSSSALPAVEAGYFFSIPPSIVRSAQKQKLVRSLPLANLLIETDSPVLGPVGQERNEPSNALLSVKEICRIKGVDTYELMHAVSENTIRLYGRIAALP
jgi:TatD DNase family protein